MVTIRVYQLPENTPTGNGIFVAGSMNGWNPADPAYRLQKDEDGILSLSLPVASGIDHLSYKIARGSWAIVEKDNAGGDIANREFLLKSDRAIQALKVARWADLASPVPSTSTELMIVLRDREITELGLKRNMRISLPPVYQSGDKRYLVLYMYDGQNLFDQSTAAFGQEWRVDVVCRSYSTSGIRPELLLWLWIIPHDVAANIIFLGRILILSAVMGQPLAMPSMIF